MSKLANSRTIQKLASPLVFLYQCVNFVRRILFKIGVFKSYKVNIPVISIGNTVMGGSGKTPFVLWLCRKLMEKGLKVVVLSRGYGRANEEQEMVIDPAVEWIPDPYDVGDEPAMMARQMPDLPVICRADRTAAAMTAIRLFNPDILILDDGFQHFKLKRDIDIILVPPQKSTWKRDFWFVARKADIIVQSSEYLPKILRNFTNKFKSERSLGTPQKIYGLGELNWEKIQGKSVGALAGISYPEVFFRMLREKGIRLPVTRGLADHFQFSDGYIRATESTLRGASCEYVFVTAKDAIKIEKYTINGAFWYSIPLLLDVIHGDKMILTVEELLKTR